MFLFQWGECECRKHGWQPSSAFGCFQRPPRRLPSAHRERSRDRSYEREESECDQRSSSCSAL